MLSCKNFYRLACIVFVFLVFAVIPAIATVHHVYEGGSIQAAIDTALSGDTIIVHEGTYIENVDIDKKLTVMGVESPLVQADTASDHIFHVTADSVNVSGFIVKGATATYKAGIYITPDYCNISYNDIYNNYHGIYLYRASNNIMANNVVHNNYKHGIYLSTFCDSNTISNNTISDNTEDGIRLTGTAGNNTIKNNTINSNSHGIWVASDSNQIIGNDVFSNTAGGSGIHLTSAASNNVIQFNNIIGNSPEGSGSYGVYNDNAAETVDATLNYWGDANGPTHPGNPSGTGDAVSDNVEYEPYFADTVKNEPTTAGTDTIDAKSTANTEVIKEGTGTPTISVAKYASNPGGTHTFTAFTGGYIDVHIDDTTDVDAITIQLHYPNTVSPEVGLALYWWNGTAWILCSQQGINTTDFPPNYGGYIWARITRTTTPNLEDLFGTPFGGGSTPIVTFYPSIAFVIFAVFVVLATIVYLRCVKCKVKGKKVSSVEVYP